jgi:hypothetical protein
LPKQSSYIVLSEHDDLKHIKSNNLDLIKSKPTKDTFDFLLKNISNKSILIFHSFTENYKYFLDSLPRYIPKIWLFWGYEGYNSLPYSYYIGYKSYNAGYPKSILSKIKCIKNYVSNFFITPHNKLHQQMIRKMDYCATWVEKDFFLAQKFNENLKHVYFSYYTSELLRFHLLEDTQSNFDKILLGNSANPTNNHIEALEYLYSIKYKGEILCPLSYGGSETYIKNVMEFAKSKFGENFIPLTSFMPLVEYQALINSCGIVWMNHQRQQAAGNLFVAFCTNKTVILDSRNPMCYTFDKWNLKYYNKENLLHLKNEKVNVNNNRNVILNKVKINENKDFFELINNLAKKS